MNVLITEGGEGFEHIARALLLGAGHRVSLGKSREESLRKLETALFDVVVAGPGGISPHLAELLENDFESMPLVLAGIRGAAPESPRIVAALTEPLSPARLLRAMDRIESNLPETDRVMDLPVDVIAGDDRLSCRARRASPTHLLIEEVRGEDAIPRFLARHGEGEWRADIYQGDRIRSVPGTLSFAERSRVSWAGIFLKEDFRTDGIVNK